jgi:hypothetical protein
MQLDFEERSCTEPPCFFGFPFTFIADQSYIAPWRAVQMRCFTKQGCKEILMQRFVSKVVGVSLGIALTLALAIPAAAQKKAAAPKQGRLSGNVQSVSKDKSEIALRKGSVVRTVIYSGNTKFNMGTSKKSSPSSIDAVKDGNYMYCGGTWEGVKLNASSCTFREGK